MSAININEAALEKTSRHVLMEAEQALQVATDRATEAKSAGSNRSRGYASLIVIAAGLLFQGGGIFALERFNPSPRHVDVQVEGKPVFSQAEMQVLRANFLRIDRNLEEISGKKDRIAPSMPIGGNIVAIREAAKDIDALVTARLPQSGNEKL